MFSSVFDKVVSATAPDALATFPPRAALPVPPSTLCCLSFVDRFLTHYPVVSMQTVVEGVNIVDLRLVGRAGVAGVALSANELDNAMQNAAELGRRLAAALAGTARSKPREARMAQVSALLAKVRGIFGNRLTCVGRDIRVSRNAKAEKDETFLLRQIHALKSAALETCNGQKWGMVVGSGGESLAVCSVPLPPTEGEGEYGCDFLVFDPWPRPAMKLGGSYVVKFTTVRGLQLHLLSALGEIWRENGRVKENAVKDEFVFLSVVMAAQKAGQKHFNTEARGLLEESVLRLRKAEKAAAIKIKREEVEALRRELAESHQKRLTDAETASSSWMGWSGTGSAKQAGVCSDLRAVSASSDSSGRSERSHQAPREKRGWANLPKHEEAIANQTTKSVCPVNDQVPAESCLEYKGGDDVRVLGNRYTAADTPPLRPPAVGISPPLLVSNNLSRRGGKREWLGDQEGYIRDGERGRKPVKETKDERVSRAGALGEKFDPLERLDWTESPENPFNRALLRSVTGEALVDYSKRAYKVCRTHEIIHIGALDVNLTHDSRRPPSSYDPSSGVPSAHDFGTTLRADHIETRGVDYEGELSAPTIQCEVARCSSPLVSAKLAQLRDPLPVDGDLDESNSVDDAAGNCATELRDALPVHDDLDESNNVDDAAGNCATELRDVLPLDGDLDESNNVDAAGSCDECNLSAADVTEPEETVSREDLRASQPPTKKFQSRLQVSHAGRALVLASANARGGLPHPRKGSRTPRLDPAGSPLPPPPPVSNSSGCSTEVWNSDVALRAPPGTRRAQSQAKREVLCFGDGNSSSDLVSGEAVTAERIASDNIPFGNYKCNSKGRDENQGGDCGGAKQCLVGAAARRGHGLPNIEPPRRQKILENGEEFAASPPSLLASKNNDRFSRKLKGRSGCTEDGGECTRRLSEEDASSLVDVPFPLAKLPRVETETNNPISMHPKYGLHCDGLTTAFGRPSSVAMRNDGGVMSDHVEHVPPIFPDVAEGMDARDSATFLWFGQPESPATHRSASSPSVRASILRHGQNRAKYFLQSEVRRQRDIIERAFRAREMERRTRRVQLGAEALRRFYALRRKAKRTQSSSQKMKPLSHACRREEAREAGETAPGIAAVCHDRRCAVGTKGLGSIADSAETVVTSVESNAVLDVTKTKAVDTRRRDGKDDDKLQNSGVDRVVAQESAPGLGEQTNHENIQETRAIVPQSIRFDITEDGTPREEAGAGESREQTRRKERLEALRARKIAEAEERRRIHRERQAAAREEQQQRAKDAAEEKFIKYAANEVVERGDRTVTDRCGNPTNDALARGCSPEGQTMLLRARNTNSRRTNRAPKAQSVVRDQNGGVPDGAKMTPSELARTASPAIKGLSRRSNRKLVRNAIIFLCLAGGHLQEKKMRVLKTLDSHTGSNFVLLLAHAKPLAFKGLYACSGEEDSTAVRLLGQGPPRIDTAMVSGFYKYNSAAREFREVHSKALGITTDAVSVEPVRLRKSLGTA